MKRPKPPAYLNPSPPVPKPRPGDSVDPPAGEADRVVRPHVRRAVRAKRVRGLARGVGLLIGLALLAAVAYVAWMYRHNFLQ